MQCWFLGESPARPPAVAGGVGAFGVMFLLGDGGCRCPLPAALPTHVGAPLLCLRVCLLSVFAMVGTTVSSFGRSGGCFAVVAQPVLCRRRSACVADVLPLPLLLRWILGRRWCSSLADTLLPASLWSMRILCRISSDGYLAVDGLFPSRYFAASVALVWADALPPRSCRYGGYFAAMGFAGLPSGGYFATSVVDGRVVSLGGCFATPG